MLFRLKARDGLISRPGSWTVRQKFDKKRRCEPTQGCRTSDEWVNGWMNPIFFLEAHWLNQSSDWTTIIPFQLLVQPVSGVHPTCFPVGTDILSSEVLKQGSGAKSPHQVLVHSPKYQHGVVLSLVAGATSPPSLVYYFRNGDLDIKHNIFWRIWDTLG